MAIASLIVRIGAKVDDVDKALAGVGQKASALQVRLAKLTNTPLGDAVRKSAEELEKTLKNVTDAQQRLADRARFAAQGLSALGGPARLTKTELEQVNRTIQQGLDAFRALGQQAPQDLQKVASAVKAQQTQLRSSDLLRGLPGGGLFGALAEGGLTAGLATGLTAGVAAGGAAFVLAAKNALAYADALQKLADQTSISTDALQTLEAIALPSGNTLEELASAVSQFQKRLGAGDREAINAIQRLGLSLTELRQLSPDQQLLAIATAFQKIGDPAVEAAIGAALFGRSFKDILPTLKADVESLAKDVPRMSANAVSALDKIGDALTRLQRQLKVETGQLLFNFLNGLTLGSLGVSAQLERDFASIKDAAKAIPKSEFLPVAATATAGKNLDDLTAALQKNLPEELKAAEGAAKHAAAIAELGAQLSGGKALSGMHDLAEAWRAQPAAIKENIQAIDRLVKAYEPLAEQLDPSQLPKDLEALSTALRVINRTAEASAAPFGRFLLNVTQLRNLAQGLTSDGLIPLAKGFSDVERSLQGVLDHEADLAKQHTTLARVIATQAVRLPGGVSPGVPTDTKAGILDQIGAIFTGADFGRIIEQALTGGGGLIGALKAVFSRIGGTLSESLAAAIGGSISGTLGKVLSGIVGPLGNLLGPVIAGIGRLIRGAPEWKKLQSDIGRDLGVNISDGLAKQLEADSGRFGRQITESLHLDEIISEAGGIQTFGLDKAIGRLHDLFTFLDQGRLTLRQVGQEFDKVFAELVPEAIEKGTGLASAAFANLVTLARQKGISSPELDKFVTDQLGGVLSGLAAGLKSGPLAGQGAASGFGGAIAAAFAGLQERGVPVLQIFRQLQPLIDQFNAKLKAAGLSGGAAFEEIARLGGIAQKFAPAIQGVDGIRQALAGLANTGLLSEETFSGLAQQIGSTFSRLQAQGVNSNDALRLMQPSLQTLWELEKRFGFTADQATQSLLNQAEAQGLVGAKFQSPAERMVSALEDISSILTKIAKQMGVDLGDAAIQAARDVTTAAGDMNTALSNIQVPTFSGPAGPVVIDFPFPTFGATGGRVTARGIQHFAEGGRVLPFLARGRDTVPALLSPGEIVLNKAQQERIAEWVGRGGVTGGVTHVHVEYKGQELFSILLDQAQGGKNNSKFTQLVRRAR